MAEQKLICQECGCHCDTCVNNNSVHLYREIEMLKRRLAEREYHIVQMETSIMHHAKQYPNGEMVAMQDSVRFWQEKYERLLEGHRKLQKVNQGLEDKLLRIADKFETEKSALTRDVADLTTKLVDARLSISELEEENDQYKNDCTIAVQLLQCKPSNFVSHKFSTLPSDLQEKVRLHMNHRRTRSNPCNTPMQSSGAALSNNGAKIIRVPISTFPPTAMVYSINRVPEESSLPLSNGVEQTDNSPDYVSAAIMAKVLEERTKERMTNNKRTIKCHQCRNRKAFIQYIDEETQTNNAILNYDDYQFNNSNGVNRQRSESSSSMDSLTNYSYCNYGNNCTRSSMCNETIII